MDEILNFAFLCTEPAKVRLSGVPAQFKNTVDRNQSNLSALSTALKAAGVSPVAAAGYMDAAMASFQNALIVAVAQ